jgi:DNA-binding transcriptional LysR family regulator
VNVDLRSLLHFAVVAEEESFTAAARRLGIAQPWLSQRILALEARLGFDLFQRQGRRIVLTANGAAMFDRARPLVNLGAELNALADQLSKNEWSGLKLGAPPYAHRIPVVNDLLGGMGARYPHANITFDVGWSSHLVDRVRHGDLDATFALEPFDPTDLDVIGVGNLVRLYTPPAGSIAHGRPVIDAGDLAGRAVAAFPRDVNPGLYDLAFGPLIAAGVDLVPVAFDGRPMRGDISSDVIVPSYFGVPDPVAKPNERTLGGAAAIPFRFVSRHDNSAPLVRAARDAVMRASRR